MKSNSDFKSKNVSRNIFPFVLFQFLITFTLLAKAIQIAGRRVAHVPLTITNPVSAIRHTQCRIRNGWMKVRENKRGFIKHPPIGREGNGVSFLP